MAKFYQTKLLPAHPSSPPIGAITGLQPMKASRVRAVMAAQDKIPGLGRCILARQGLKGQSEWLAQDTVNIPDVADNRVVLRLKSYMNSGSFYELSVLAIPSGDVGDGPPQGNIDVEVTWNYNGGSESDQYQIEIEPSKETNGAEPAGAGELWTHLKHLYIKEIRPDGLNSQSTLNRWTKQDDDLEVEVTLENIGGCRIVDAALFEVPYRNAFEADDATDTLTTHALGISNLLAPAIRASETTPDGNPRLGSYHLMDVHHAQIKRLGPRLFHWTSYTEDGTAHTALEDTGITTTSATFRDLISGTFAAHDATKEGWSVGNYAHNFAQNDNNLVMQGRSGAIPVRLRVYGKTTAGTGVVRVATSSYSHVEVNVTSASSAWVTAYGWLHCGVGPEDNVVAQCFVKVSGGGTLSIQDVMVEYDRRG